MQLLSPSLGNDDSRATAIFSVRTGFLAAFFGGPLAAATIALVNAYRLKRLRTDWPIGLLAILLTVGVDWWQIRGGGKFRLDALLGAGSFYYAMRFLGLGFFAVVYAMHRLYYRSMTVLGLSAPNGLILGLTAIFGALGAKLLIDLAFSR